MLHLAKIRLICLKLSIQSIKEHQGIVTIEFNDVSNINIDKILRLIQNNAGKIYLNPKEPNKIMLKTQSIDLSTKSEFIKSKLEQLV